MEDFKMTPPVEWLEEVFDKRQKGYRRDAGELYAEGLSSGRLEYSPHLFNFKTDLCSCTEDDRFHICTALATEGANTEDDHVRLRNIDQEISRHAIAQ